MRFISSRDGLHTGVLVPGGIRPPKQAYPFIVSASQ
jgi:hypothetical protein